MKNVATAIGVIVLFTPIILLLDQQPQAAPRPDTDVASKQWELLPSGDYIRAPGRIEGATEQIELRSEIGEKITQIHVRRGQHVEVGEHLLELDSRGFVQDRELSLAELNRAEARYQKLLNGARTSEIEAARAELQAVNSALQGATKTHSRTLSLFESNSISQQALEEATTNFEVLRANAIATENRLRTLEQPARDEDIEIAKSEVDAARAKLSLAEIRIEKCYLNAPVSGTILSIDAEVGEVVSPEIPQTLITLVETSPLRCLVEIDEYDALKVVMGQQCYITCDAVNGIVAKGQISEIEPRMIPKQIEDLRVGARVDTRTRRVWITLTETSYELPIGLPVETYIR